MKNFVRISSLIISLALIINIFSGCHGAKVLGSFTVPENFDSEKNYEITFWAKNDTNKTQSQIYQQAISDFEKLYPNIKVNIRLYTDYAKIYNDVITNISTNTTPNVCITYPDHIATYSTGQNTVVSLNTLMKDENYGLGGSKLLFDSPKKEEIISEYLDECIINGNYYALPFMRSTEACYVNRDYVEKLGFTLPDVLTWDFVFEVAEAALEKDENGNYKVNGQKIMIPFIYKSTDNMMISMLKQLNADYSNENGDILIFNDTTKSILNQIAPHAASGAFSTFKISSYPANFLNAGQCIFAVDSTAGSTWMGSEAPLSDISSDKIIDFNTEVMTIPQYDTDNIFMISQGPSVCIFNKDDSGEVLASWLFAQYLLTNEVQIAYAETEGYVPVTLKARNAAEYISYLENEGKDNTTYYQVKIKATKLLLENVENTFVTPVFNGSASLRDAAGQLIENVTKSERRKETVDDTYIDNLFTDISSLYRLDTLQSASSGNLSDLGPLPTTSKILLISLGSAWLFIFIYVFVNKIKQIKKR